ncbi:MAG: aldehyde dehydrogenase family protein [Parasphingorhabdus sp.]|uniref:aldehyde dehydrogenase family protein n=2 Tax=Parasphingorhabdus sp. TaxID=2709688 RepID=UPI0032969D13
MQEALEFYIDGQWQQSQSDARIEVTNPSTEEAYAVIALGGDADTNAAVTAANTAFDGWSQTSKEERLALLEKLLDIYGRRAGEMGETISKEMGAPIDWAKGAQAGSGFGHIKNFIETLKEFEFDRLLNDNAPNDRILYEAVGICALITPWNWPINQVTLKVIAALAAGCTIILKPSEIAPMSALIFAEMIDEAGFPKGVFNLVNGDGMGVGTQLTSHPDVDMVSFTGSTRAGKLISKSAADTVKRVHLELGGKGANIIFADARDNALAWSVKRCFGNSGQSCNAPTRLLVERSVYNDAVTAAADAANATAVDMASKQGNHIGPLVSQLQFDKVQTLIETGIGEGARLVAGGPGRPEGITEGYFVRPTVFADVNNEMEIAREEIFGPVLSIIPFDDEEEAIRIANDTVYGLTNYVQTEDSAKATRVARRLRSGMVEINGMPRSAGAPFGGYKQSGNGREGGSWGIEDFLEVKSVSGWASNQ